MKPVRSKVARVLAVHLGVLCLVACTTRTGPELAGAGGSVGSGGSGGSDPGRPPTETGGTTASPDDGLIIDLPAPEDPVPSDEVCNVAILGDPGANPSANFVAWLGARGPVVERFGSETGLASLTAAQLSAFDVVFLDWLAPETTVGVTPDQLADWVESGGRMVALSGYGDYAEALTVQNQMLAPLDLAFVTTTTIWGPATQFAPHSITADLTSLTFVGGREILSLPGDEVLITIGAPGAPVGVTALRGHGRAFLFGDEWVTFDSEWSALPEIEQFWVNVFAWLGDCEIQPIFR